MGKAISDLSVILGATISPMQAAFGSAATSVENLKAKVGSTAGAFLQFTGIGAGLAAGMGAVRGVFGGVSDSISMASTLEQNQVAFETMTGSAEKASALMKDIGAFAAETPFEFPELASSAKKLLAFGTSADQIVPTMRSLGDISSGIGAPLNEIAELFGKAKVQGTLMSEDINQLVGRGIPVIQQFAKQMGVAEGEVKDLASKGKIDFGMLQKAVIDMTAEGGQFSGMMAKQSQTLGGLWSTFTDGIGMSMAGMVQSIVDAFHLKGALTALIGFTGNVGSVLQSAVGVVAPMVMGVGGRVVGVLGGIFGSIYGVVAPVATGIASFVAESWSGIQSTAVSAFTGVYDAVAGVMGTIYGYIAPVVAGIVSTVTGSWASVLATTIGYASGIYNVWSGVYIAAWEVVKTAGSGIAAAWTWAMDALGLATVDAKGVTEGALGGIIKAVQWFYETTTLAMNVVAFGLRNFDLVIGSVMAGAAYSVVKFGNEAAYTFTDVIPGYLTWFGRNWQQIFTDMATMTGTVFTNLASNVGSFFSALWSAMTGGDFDFEWKGLTDGFKSALTELPQIAERQIGPIEQILGDTSAAMNAELSQGLGEYLNEQDKKTQAAADAIKRAAGGIGDSIGSALNGGATQGMSVMADDVAEFFNDNPAGIKIDNKPAIKAIDQTKNKAAELNSFVVGSAEAMQAQAMAQARALTVQAAPVSTPAAKPMSDWKDNSPRARDEQAQANIAAALLKMNGTLATIATNTGKPQVKEVRSV